ncbi:MAG TPA: large conductance mechanosensitive channel protein MscL [Bryobacteraceae bacterium]|nr:large conductance mechanosensitive channel protein MscL [Bryobacteraceae bacterium]HUK16239.1 large conductance mechanosensitive channel protein MscL [Bryobacteraceae bacterium]
MLKGFRDFLMKNSVLALAIGFIMGAATGKVVSSLVADIIMPLLSPLIPGGEWRTAKLILSRTVGADGKEVVNAVSYGNFFGNVIDFLVIAFVVYLITKALIKEAPAAPTKNCPRCTEALPVQATKCKFCTADL